MARESEEQAEILAHVPNHYVFGVWRNVLIAYWLNQANGAALQQLAMVMAQLVEAHPRGVSIVHLVREGAGLPDAAARDGLAKLGDRYANETACLAIVMMGAGFWASALQSVLTGIRLLAPPRPSLMRFARDVHELDSWFPAEHLRRSGVRLEGVHVLFALSSVCRIGDTRGPSAVAAAAT